jgi:hypothetical protein
MSVMTGKLLTAEEFALLPEPPDGSKQEPVRYAVLTETDTLDGGDVLPGFSCRVAELVP